jgi:aspartyl-tRNA(Asn)/glutamyl-tRNA(Gln) amidotransferase subunit C
MPATVLTAEDVRRTAALARLALSDSEVAEMTVQLGRVLEYVAILGELDTTDVEPMAHAVELRNVFRSDEPTESLPREESLSNAPRTDGRYFLVPPVIGGS